MNQAQKVRQMILREFALHAWHSFDDFVENLTWRIVEMNTHRWFRKRLIIPVILLFLAIGTVVLAQSHLGMLPVNVTVIEVPVGVTFWEDDQGTVPLVKLWLGTARHQYTQQSVVFYLVSATDIDLALSSDGGPPAAFQPSSINAQRGQVYPITVTFSYTTLGAFDFNIVADEVIP